MGDVNEMRGEKNWMAGETFSATNKPPANAFKIDAQHFTIDSGTVDVTDTNIQLVPSNNALNIGSYTGSASFNDVRVNGKNLCTWNNTSKQVDGGGGCSAQITSTLSSNGKQFTIEGGEVKMN
jgi:hypothetical protein